MSSSESLFLPYDVYPYITNAAPDRRTLYNLCLTSKSLCNAAQSRLYRSYKQGFRRGNVMDPAPIRPFIRTLLDRPDLARHVKKISLQKVWADQEEYVEWEQWKRDQDAKVDELKHQCWGEHGNSERGIAGVEVAAVKELLLLLHLTPNVQGLILDTSLMSISYFNPLMTMFLSWAPQDLGRRTLEKLTTLVLDNSRSRKCGKSASLLDFQELLRSPVLRTLICFGLDMRPRIVPQRASIQTIQNIYIQDFRFDPHQAQSFFLQCPDLKSIRAVINPIMSSPNIFMDHYIHPIKEALEKHVDSLESLTLDFVESCRGSNELVRGDLNLQSFGKLSYLDLSCIAIHHCPGTSMFTFLPPSLEYLILRGCKPNVLSHLRECFAKGQRPLPLLRAITLVAGNDWNLNTGIAEQIEVEAAVRKAGIELNLIRIIDTLPSHYPIIDPQWSVAPGPTFIVDVNVR